MRCSVLQNENKFLHLFSSNGLHTGLANQRALIALACVYNGFQKHVFEAEIVSRSGGGGR